MTSLWLPLLLVSALSVGCRAGEGTALVSLTVNGQSLDVANHRVFSVDAASLSAQTRVQYETENPRARVTLRIEDGTGLLLRDNANNRMNLAAGQRLEVEVFTNDASTVYGVSVPPVDLYPVVADGDLGDTLFMMTPRDFSKAEQPSGYNRYQLVVDGRGVPVWWRESPGLSFDFRVTERGNFSLNTQLEQGGTMESVILRPEGAEILDQWTPSQPAEWNTVRTDAHELWVFEDGSTLQSIRGNRQEDLSSIGGLVDGRVSATGVQERDANGIVTAEWTAFETIDLTLLPVDVLAQLNDDEPFWAAHINSVEPVDGGWILSLRSPGEVVRVDRSSGDVVWRLGGPRSDFAFVDDPLGGFFGQHSARWLGDDQLALFDNRINFDSEPVGHVRMVVYQLDFDVMTATLILSHEAPGAGGADFAGLVTRLPNGDFIVGWGSTQRLGDGTKAPIATRLGPDGVALGTLTLPDDSYSYRVWPSWGDSTTGTYRNTL